MLKETPIGKTDEGDAIFGDKEEKDGEVFEILRRFLSQELKVEEGI